MFVGDEIINKVDNVDVFPDTSPGKNILTGAGRIKKVKKFSNGSTSFSVKLDVYGSIYSNKSLKDTTKNDILNRLYSDSQKRENVVIISRRKNIYEEYERFNLLINAPVFSML